MKETIFFMTYKTYNNEGFKQEYFNHKKTLAEFHNWLMTKQQEIEIEKKQIVV